MKKLTIIYAITAAILVQFPLGYFFISLEGLVLGHGFIGIPNGFELYLISILVVSAFIIIVIGTPLYFTLKHYKLNTSLYITISGLIIPILIMTFIDFGITSYKGYSAGENYYGTYRDTFIDGQRTFWGWVKVLESMVTYGIHGVLGAIIFHKIYLKGNNA